MLKQSINMFKKDMLPILMKMILWAILHHFYLADKNIIVNNLTLKGDSYFLVVDAKTQRGDEVSNDNQREFFQQTSLRIDCNTPEKAVLSKSSGSVQENVSENISDLKT